MRLALAQLDARLGDVEANAERARQAIGEATAAGADLVVFPELYLSGYGLRELEPDAARATSRTADEVAALVGGPALVGFREAAWEGQTPDTSEADEGTAEISLQPKHDAPNGTRPGSDPPSFNSAALVLEGRAVHVHRKLYLVDYEPFGEHELFAPGSELRPFDTPLGRCATLICNDAWQPFLPFIATEDGAGVVLVPSCSSTAVPEAEGYWRELTRFHARMLQCFVVFVNRVGSEPGFTFWGGSHVVGPDGTTLVDAPRFEEAMLYADLDLEQVEDRRRRLTIVGDPRLDLVRAELERLARNRGHAPR